MSTLNGSALGQRNLPIGARPERRFAVDPPSGTRRQSVFADAILDAGAGNRAKRAAQTGVALAMQAAVVAALVLVPLFFSKGIDLYQLNRTLLVAPPPPAAPSPPAQRAQVLPTQRFMHAQLSAPTIIPNKITVTAAPDAGMAPAVAEMSGGVPGGMGGVLGGELNGPPPPPPPSVSANPKGPIRISGGMKEPRLVYGPPALYPALARQTHIAGSVFIEAIIDEHGNVTQVHVLSGPALLLGAAMRAVSLRKYEPTILDGEPVAIELKVEVAFHLS
jgi:outer membrane biosynthesis protein TonB